MTPQRPLVALCFAVLTLAGCREAVEPRRIAASFSEGGSPQDDETANVLAIDHRVPHVSTVPANAGQTVELFVRERVRSDPGNGKPRKAVLMIHGRSVPVLAAMELRHADYDWALWLARSGGFDVFMLDFQGSGRSPRPKMDNPCNVPEADQKRLLIPNRPLTAPCLPEYPFTLNTAGSDLDELDTVVEYIKQQRGVEKVHLVAWSAGSFRIGAYAVQHPDKVASLLFFAPIFNAGIEPDKPPPPPPTNPPAVLPRPGTPIMNLISRADAFVSWDAEARLAIASGRCENPIEPGIQDVVWRAIMENDEVGQTWGPPEGVMRVRQVVQWGWNREVASQLIVPTLIIRGEFDMGEGGHQHLAELYDLVKNDNKLRFTVACAGHRMNWEKQRGVLHQISKEWIKHGRVGGFDSGEFRVDTEGNLTPEPTP